MPKFDEIAIVGLYCRLPDSPTPHAFWQNLLEQHCAIQNHRDPSSPEPKDWASYRAIIEKVDCFDYEHFGFSIEQAKATSPQHRLLLEACASTLDQLTSNGICLPELTGVLACEASDHLYWQALAEESTTPLAAYQNLLGNDKDFLATQIAYKLDLKGPSYSIQTGCSSSLVATHLACRGLQMGDLDLALVGGVSAALPLSQPEPHVEGMIYAANGLCQPYTNKASGTVNGMGVVVIALQRLSDAIDQNNPVWAVIKGSAINNDGSNKVSFTSPAVDSHINVINKALKHADIDANQVASIEGHGTGTSLGDAIELTALNSVYGQQRKNPCYLGSVKANIGHLDAASGLASLAKVTLSLSQGILPPQRYAEDACEQASGTLALNAHAHPLSDDAIIAISSLGVGGTNAHMLVQAASNQCLKPTLDSNQLSFKATPVPLPKKLMATEGVGHMPTSTPALQGTSSTHGTVLEAWQMVLGNQNSAPDQNFFTVGGDSLTAIQLITHINSTLSLNLSHTTLFSYPTLGDLSNYVASMLENEAIDYFEYEEL